MKFDGRAARRVYMSRPAVAKLADRQVEVRDLSETGFGIAHDFPLQPGHAAVLEFRWGVSFALRCVVVRCRRDGAIFRTGLRIEDSPRAFRERVAAAVARKRAEEAKLPPIFSTD